jgi:hypothetical protein
VTRLTIDYCTHGADCQLHPDAKHLHNFDDRWCVLHGEDTGTDEHAGPQCGVQQCIREDVHGPHRPLGAVFWCEGFVGRAGVAAPQDKPRIQLAVLFNDHTTMYYPCTDGWRFDAPSRCIVVGRGVPRTHIPLDQVRSFEVLDVAPTASEVHGG